MDDFRGYDEMSMDQLADLRAWQLERLERVSEALRARVRAEYTPGQNMKALAKKLGVTRKTAYAWISE
jgi:transposase-like protein